MLRRRNSSGSSNCARGRLHALTVKRAAAGAARGTRRGICSSSRAALPARSACRLRPRLNSARVELLDSPRLISQLCGLERRTARGGRDSIDHGPGGHDDLANAVAGALVLAAGTLTTLEIWARFAKADLGPAPGTLPQSAILYAYQRFQGGFQ